MFKFLLFIFILIYVIYKISTFYVKTFIGKSVNNFKKSNIELNRKMLAQIAVLDTSTFNELIKSSN